MFQGADPGILDPPGYISPEMDLDPGSARDYLCRSPVPSTWLHLPCGWKQKKRVSLLSALGSPHIFISSSCHKTRHTFPEHFCVQTLCALDWAEMFSFPNKYENSLKQGPHPPRFCLRTEFRDVSKQPKFSGRKHTFSEMEVNATTAAQDIPRSQFLEHRGL